jgi:hypothetical protein
MITQLVVVGGIVYYILSFSFDVRASLFVRFAKNHIVCKVFPLTESTGCYDEVFYSTILTVEIRMEN